MLGVSYGYVMGMLWYYPLNGRTLSAICLVFVS